MPHHNLCYRKTNWEDFRLLLTDHLDLNVTLITTSDIEATINTFTNLIQWAGWTSTPEPLKVRQASNRPLFIKQKLLEKRRLRRTWFRFRSPYVKRQLNKATRELKQLLSDNNASFQHYIQNLSPTASTDYSLRKAVKKIKHIPSSSPHYKQLKAPGHQPFGICFSATPLHQLTWRGGIPHPSFGIPLPT
jgi:hypothetical protein